MSSENFFVHESAIIDEEAKIGEGTKIWHWVHVSAGAKIGKNCVLGQNVFVGNRVIIGNGVKIQNNVSVYDDVTIENDVFCGPSMVFTNVYNPRAAISRKTEYQPTLVKQGASIGGNATIICGLILGRYCLVGAGSVVTKNVPDYALIVGNPARQIGWVGEYGEKLARCNESGLWICEKTGKKYSEQEGALFLDE